MPTSLANLPPVPPALKPITPYLQRAEELRKQDPVISYWCAYYAAQVGISLKARDAASRDLLFALLGALEQTKKQIGPSDAIDIETVSSAYVENFALKVFANADNEDRSSHATRSTAKKFLAAANFLEVLKTFPKSDISESNEDKIRYAKWKAADIAKAFREGRKPDPGPPGWAEEQHELELLQRQQQEQEQIHSALTVSPPMNPSDSSVNPTPPRTIPRSSPPHSPHGSTHSKRSSPPAHIDLLDTSSSSPLTEDHLKVNRSYPTWIEKGDDPPECWSTAATPGTSETPATFIEESFSPSSAGPGWDHPSPTSSTRSSEKKKWDGVEEKRKKPRSGSGSSSSTIGSNSGKGVLKNSMSSSPPKPSSIKSGSPESDKRVHFSPSTIGSGELPPPPQPHLGSPPKEYRGPSSIYAPPHSPTLPRIDHGPSIPPNPSTYPSQISPSSSSPTRSHNIYAPPSNQYSPTRSTGPYGRPTVPPPPPPIPAPVVVELTPGIIAKAQKHCRFAISSLDYEDAEQAKKELRAALAILGG